MNLDPNLKKTSLLEFLTKTNCFRLISLLIIPEKNKKMEGIMMRNDRIQTKRIKFVFTY